MRVVYNVKCTFKTKEIIKKLFYWDLSKERVIGKKLLSDYTFK